MHRHKLYSAAARIMAGAALFAFLGCAGKRHARAPSWEVAEVVTIEGQAREEILDTPTDFYIPLYEDRSAWQRAKSFIETHTTAPTDVLLPKPRKGSLVSLGYSERYAFAIEKRVVQGVMHYTVSCAARALPEGRELGTPQQAVINAHNLARFIRDGRLERSLLQF